MNVKLQLSRGPITLMAVHDDWTHTKDEDFIHIDDIKVVRHRLVDLLDDIEEIDGGDGCKSLFGDFPFGLERKLQDICVLNRGGNGPGSNFKEFKEMVQELKFGIEHTKDRIKYWKAEMKKWETKLEEMEDRTDETGTSLISAAREGVRLKIDDARVYLHANQWQLVRFDPEGRDEETRSLLQGSEWEVK